MLMEKSVAGHSFSSLRAGKSSRVNQHVTQVAPSLQAPTFVVRNDATGFNIWVKVQFQSFFKVMFSLYSQKYIEFEDVLQFILHFKNFLVKQQNFWIKIKSILSENIVFLNIKKPLSLSGSGFFFRFMIDEELDYGFGLY